MLIDKPAWVRHEKHGRDVEHCPLFSVDIDVSGQRLATTANDNKVRIWAMGPILNEQQATDPSVPKVLATLTDHFEPVNVARFSPDGRLIASGSDSKLVVINQLVPGPASVRFGDKDAPSVENWKQMHVLRGHKSNVTDISWSPDGKRLASASLDNLVIVWDVASGRQVTQLEGHYGYVKGVAWDPFGMYIATQGEQDGVFIWRVGGDWSLVAKVKTGYSSSADQAMHARLSWSPDGQSIVCTNMVNKSTNQYVAPIISRTSWDSNLQFVGHRLTISAAKFNPCHFYPRKEPNSDEATTLCVLGSYDNKVTLWSRVENTPMMQAENKLFKRAVMDMAWTADGMAMVVCSVDGTIALFQFSETDLGKKVPEKEVKELLHTLYGDPQVRQRTLLADPELLKLQPANGATAGPSGTTQAKLSSRLGPGGSEGFAPPPAPASVPSAPAPAPAAAAAPNPPPRPTVTMTTGGRKRIMPTPVGDTAALHGLSSQPQPQAPAVTPTLTTTQASTDSPTGMANASPPSLHLQQQQPQQQHTLQPPVKRQATSTMHHHAAPHAAPSAVAQTQLQQQPAQFGVGGPAVLGRGAVLAGAQLSAAPHPSTAGNPTFVLAPPPAVSLLHVPLGAYAGDVGEAGGGMVVLEAANTARDHRGRQAAKLQCSQPGGLLWHDSVQGCVMQGAGGPNFCAVSTSLGDMLLFSPAGRRMLPPIQLGCPAVVMAVSGWRLMVLTTDGRVRVWDVQIGKLTLEADAACLLRGPAAKEGSLLTARLTHTGAPLLIMRNHHAYTYNTGWACWMRVADDAFPASQFHSSFSGSHGMLGRIQAEVAIARQPADVLAAANQPAEVQRRAARAHLECNIASALALQSPQEWRRWLVTYVRQLAADEDEARLKEVLNELLGPVRWAPVTHGAAAAAGRGWEPTVMGLDKRQMLRFDVLRELSRVRSAALQSLAAQMLEALKEAEAHVAASAANTGLPPALPAATGLGLQEARMTDSCAGGGGFGSQLMI